MLERFAPPSGRGVRVDTAAAAGYRVDPRFDTMLAKVVVHEPRGDLAPPLAAAARAVEEFDVAGPPTAGAAGPAAARARPAPPAG